MAIFDEYIQKVAEYVETMRQKGHPSKEFSCPEVLTENGLTKDLPIKVGPKANPGIILRDDTFAELGNPVAGSRAVFLWTDNPSLITNGRITLFGPDIPESSKASLPFAQIFIVGGNNFREKRHEAFVMGAHVSDQIEGYMVRSSTGNMWSRVSNDVAAKGFSFEVLGKAMMKIFKLAITDVQAMEIVFVTTSKDDVMRLNEMSKEIADINQDIIKEVWKAKGYDLDCNYDCSSCMDQSVCDSIREVIDTHRKKGRAEASK